MIHPVASSDALLHEIRALIEDARRQVAHAANAGLTIAYWRIGKRLLTENLTDGRGEYGQQILASLAQQLERDYGKASPLPGVATSISRKLPQRTSVTPTC